MQGDKLFTVRGIMKPGGMASAFGGNLAIMDIYAAQKFFGRGRSSTASISACRTGVTLERGQAANCARCWDPASQSNRPSGRGAAVRIAARASTRWRSNITSMFALFIGMFIIYNTFAIAVTQRRSEIGILRALGATRWQIRTLFLGESAVAGLIGSAVGVGIRTRVRARL